MYYKDKDEETKVIHPKKVKPKSNNLNELLDKKIVQYNKRQNKKKDKQDYDEDNWN